MNKKYLTPEELNARLQSTRHQGFRKQTERQLVGRNAAAMKQREFYKNNPEASAKKSISAKFAQLDTYCKGTYIVRSPGNDLLDFYDMMHKRKLDAPKSNITPIPPSRIFEFRYRTQLPIANGANQFSGPTQTDIYRQVCSPYADDHDSKKIAGDKIVLYKWLLDKPSVQKEFKLNQHAVDYLTEIKGKNQRGIDITVHTDNPVHETIFWKGPVSGYSIIFLEND